MNLLIIALMLSAQPQEGTLVFVKGGNRIVQSQTNSDITHVGIIFTHRSEPYVYEATPPRVRKLPLREYIKEIEAENKKHPKNQRKLLYVQPASFSEQQIAAMKRFAESQLGRPYSVKSYIRGKERTTIHCSEYVSRTLQMGGEMIDTPSKQTPDSLLKKYAKD